MNTVKKININKPKIKIHDRDLRGGGNMGWLNTKHTFSFGHFMDPNRMGFRSLRVINDDIVAPGSGFGMHPHKNMEIITIVLDGALEHKDSIGNGSVIRPGEIQKMSAGSGITHSEYNHSPDDPVHLYQIWVLPDQRGIKPSYEQIKIDSDALKDEFVLIGDREPSDNMISIHQDAKMYMAMPNEGTKLTYVLDQNRYAFLQVAKGHITMDGEILKEGDGAEISGLETIDITALSDAQLILFDIG